MPPIVDRPRESYHQQPSDPADLDVCESLRRYWDDDAPTYDLAPSHVAHTPAEQAAWAAALLHCLPPPPGRVLDVGAGTGALSLPLARLGFHVTALDISPRMLEQLRCRAAEMRLEVETIEGRAESPPSGSFDAVVERLVLWTLADPQGALAAWRRSAPGGRLVSFGGVWGVADRIEATRERIRQLVRRLRGYPREHHAPYDPDVCARLPFGRGMMVSSIVAIVEGAGWRSVRVERLSDVEWARSLSLPLAERVLGVTPEFVVIADDAR